MDYTRKSWINPPHMTALNMVQEAATVLDTWTAPFAFDLLGIMVTVTTACGNTTSAIVSVGKGTSTDFVELIKTTGVGISAAIGVSKYDAIRSVATATNHFAAGDKLELRVGTTATSTGKVDVSLLIATDL